MTDTGSLRFARLVRDVASCCACAAVAHAHVLGSANGRLDARVLFVAEAVGRRGGAVTGVPLTRDESGRRFAHFLALADIDRSDAFITNAVLCNPLDGAGRNRTPALREVANCRPFLVRTLDAVPAPIVVALGRVALDALGAIAPHDLSLAQHVATPHGWRGRIIVPMYHPSRQSTLHRPDALQEDDWRRLGALLYERLPAGPAAPTMTPHEPGRAPLHLLHRPG
jgi:uracil-DNA glycosylase family 4